MQPQCATVVSYMTTSAPPPHAQPSVLHKSGSITHGLSCPPLTFCSGYVSGSHPPTSVSLSALISTACFDPGDATS